MSDREFEEQRSADTGDGKQVAKVSATAIVDSVVGTPATQATGAAGMQQQPAALPRMQDLGGFSAATENAANRQQGMHFSAETMHALLQQIAANNVYRADNGMKDGDVVDRKGGTMVYLIWLLIMFHRILQKD